MRALLIPLFAAAWAGAAPEAKVPPKPVRVLLVTGVDHPAHDWKRTTPALRTVLERDPRLEVRIVEDPEVLATDLVFDYDVVFLSFKNYKPLAREKQARANLVRFVRGGRGLVLLHHASGAFEDWPGFGELAGRVWDRKNSHDPRGRFAVRIVNPKHPVTRGLKDFQADDELYICLEGSRPVEVLAVARSRVTGKDHPMAFVCSCGKGRVFHSTLGHDARSVQVPAVGELLRNGCLWAAGRLR